MGTNRILFVALTTRLIRCKAISSTTSNEYHATGTGLGTLMPT